MNEDCPYHYHYDYLVSVEMSVLCTRLVYLWLCVCVFYVCMNLNLYGYMHVPAIGSKDLSPLVFQTGGVTSTPGATTHTGVH